MASTFPHLPQKGLPHFGVAARGREEGRGENENKRNARKRREVENACNKREQRERKGKAKLSRQRENRRKGRKDKENRDVRVENKMEITK